LHTRLAKLYQFAVMTCSFTPTMYVLKNGNVNYATQPSTLMTPGISASNESSLKVPLHRISSSSSPLYSHFPFTPAPPQSSFPSNTSTMPCSPSITATNPPLVILHCSSSSLNSLTLMFSNPPCSAKARLVSKFPSKQFIEW
jgi:hypothetical protein